MRRRLHVAEVERLLLLVLGWPVRLTLRGLALCVYVLDVVAVLRLGPGGNHQLTVRAAEGSQVLGAQVCMASQPAFLESLFLVGVLGVVFNATYFLALATKARRHVRVARYAGWLVRALVVVQVALHIFFVLAYFAYWSCFGGGPLTRRTVEAFVCGLAAGQTPAERQCAAAAGLRGPLELVYVAAAATVAGLTIRFVGLVLAATAVCGAGVASVFG